MLKIYGQIVKAAESEYGAFVDRSSGLVFHGPGCKPHPCSTRQSMNVIKITRHDLRSLVRLTIKRRSDCVASFSVNEKREIWMYVTRGWTKEEKRKYVLGECPVVERIAEVYLAERPEGGRIFLKRDGLFYRPFGKGSDVPFAGVEFEDRP